jgi:hypothetical protein
MTFGLGTSLLGDFFGLDFSVFAMFMILLKSIIGLDTCLFASYYSSVLTTTGFLD